MYLNNDKKNLPYTFKKIFVYIFYKKIICIGYVKQVNKIRVFNCNCIPHYISEITSVYLFFKLFFQLNHLICFKGKLKTKSLQHAVLQFKLII